MGSRCVRLLRLILPTLRSPFAKGSPWTDLFRRRTHELEVAGLYERCGRKRLACGGRNTHEQFLKFLAGLLTFRMRRDQQSQSYWLVRLDTPALVVLPESRNGIRKCHFNNNRFNPMRSLPKFCQAFRC